MGNEGSRPASPHSSSSQPRQTFTMGQRVEARWKSGRTWYKGTINNVNSDGTYAIQFDDGDYTPFEVPTADRMRPLAGSAVAAPSVSSQSRQTFTMGQRVEAKWKSGRTWYKGTINNVNSDGTYAIKFDDGDYTASEVPTADRMRPLGPAVAAPSISGQSRQTFTMGQRVEAKWKSGRTWYKGTINNVNSDGTYAIKFDDGDYTASEVPTADRMRPLAGPAVAAPSVSSQSRQTFAKGQRVEAKYRNLRSWYKGTVDKVNGDGTYAIKFDDGDYTASEVPTADRMRPLGPAPLSSVATPAPSLPTNPSTLSVGDRVSASWRTTKKKWPGRVSKDNHDGTYAVQYDDGDFEPRIKKSDIFTESSPFPQFSAKPSGWTMPSMSPGSTVRSYRRYGSRGPFPGRITAINHENITVAFDDGDVDTVPAWKINSVSGSAQQAATATPAPPPSSAPTIPYGPPPSTATPSAGEFEGNNADSSAHCTFTRQELQDLLVQSEYGSKAAMFAIYFRREGNQILCSSCQRALGYHAKGYESLPRCCPKDFLSTPGAAIPVTCKGDCAGAKQPAPTEEDLAHTRGSSYSIEHSDPCAVAKYLGIVEEAIGGNFTVVIQMDGKTFTVEECRGGNSNQVMYRV